MSSREEAIKTLQAMDDIFIGDCTKEAIDMAIEALSTGRPKGQWNPISADRVRCTNCDAIRDITAQLFWNYCPNCGADMRGEER